MNDWTGGEYAVEGSLRLLAARKHSTRLLGDSSRLQASSITSGTCAMACVAGKSAATSSTLKFSILVLPEFILITVQLCTITTCVNTAVA